MGYHSYNMKTHPQVRALKVGVLDVWTSSFQVEARGLVLLL